MVAVIMSPRGHNGRAGNPGCSGNASRAAGGGASVAVLVGAIKDACCTIEHSVSYDTLDEKMLAATLKALNRQIPSRWIYIADALPQLEQIYECAMLSQPTRQLLSLIAAQLEFQLESYRPAIRHALEAKDTFLALFSYHYGGIKTPQQKQILESVGLSGTADLQATRNFVDKMTALTVDEYIRRSQEDAATAASDSIGTLSPALANGIQPGGQPTSQLPSYLEATATEDIPKKYLEEFVQVIFASGGVGAADKSMDKSGAIVYSEELARLLAGVALEARSLELSKTIINWSVRTSKSAALLRYIVRELETLVQAKSFRREVLSVAATIYKQFFGDESFLSKYEELPSYAEVLVTLDDNEGFAKILDSLLKSEKKDFGYSVALQLCLDVSAYAPTSFLSRLLEHVQPDEDAVPAAVPVVEAAVANKDTDCTEETELLEKTPAAAPVSVDTTTALATTGSTTVATTEVAGEETLTAKSVRNTIRDVLSHELQTKVFLKFLHQTNATDLTFLDSLKSTQDGKILVLRTFAVIAHSLMQYGTACDIYIRKNLEWFTRCHSWAKYVATATLGVVHQYQREKSFQLLMTNLPPEAGAPATTGARSSYSEGGALYSLGLMHAGCNTPRVTSYLVNQLLQPHAAAPNHPPGAQENAEVARGRALMNEVLQHGGALALGLVSMGSQNAQFVTTLKDVLYTDSVTASEMAGIGIGLIAMGSGDKGLFNDLMSYAHETRHEKIIRQCSLACALILYGQEAEADPMINVMLEDSDALIRYGGCYAVGLAYCGTGRDKAVYKLLHEAVADVSDDVRRAAVISLAFVLCNAKEQLPRIMSLLSVSFNTQVRVGAALGLGIGLAGSGHTSTETLTTLKLLAKDTNESVKQAAYIALGLVLMQAPEPPAPPPSDKTKTKAESTPEHILFVDGYLSPNVLRDFYVSVSKDKHRDILCRIGALAGAGLLDAGGRNVTSTFGTQRGSRRQQSVVGYVLFTQYWFWFPLFLNISLTFVPTGLMAITADIKSPTAFQVTLADDPANGDFAYPTTYATRVLAKQPTGPALKSRQLATGSRTQPKEAEPATQAADLAKDSNVAAAAAAPAAPAATAAEAPAAATAAEAPAAAAEAPEAAVPAAEPAAAEPAPAEPAAAGAEAAEAAEPAAGTTMDDSDGTTAPAAVAATAESAAVAATAESAAMEASVESGVVTPAETKVAEKTPQTVLNFQRLTPVQEGWARIKKPSRFVPVFPKKKLRCTGITVVVDSRPGDTEPCALEDAVSLPKDLAPAKTSPKAAAPAPEVAMPAAFQFPARAADSDEDADSEGKADGRTEEPQEENNDKHMKDKDGMQ